MLDAASGGLEQIVIELTEQNAVGDYDELATVLDRARAAGARVAVDDAGAGYDSLQHVLRLRPEYVKLDRGLISDAHADPAKLAIIEAVGLFAGRLGAELVAPGIERRAEQEMLAGLAVPLGQGFLFGRPGPSLVRDVPIAGMRAVKGDLASGCSTDRSRRRSTSACSPQGPSRAAGARGQVVVVLDRDARPIGLLVPEGGGWAHRERPLSASVEEPAIDVARRRSGAIGGHASGPRLRVPARRALRRPGRRRAPAGRRRRPVGRVIPATRWRLTHRLKPRGVSRRSDGVMTV